MRILITIMLLWSSVTAFSQEIWQLSPWAPDSSYVISAMSSGEPTWVKVDSLGVADSIYISGDSIRLRDGAGVAQLPTASTSTKGLLSSTDWNTFNGKGGGSGTVTSITTTSPLTGGTITSTGTIGIQTASGSQAGALSSTDWTLFNNKFTLPSLTSGSVLFSNGTTIAQDNSKFFWNNTNKRLGIGTNAPQWALDISGSDIRVNGCEIGLGGGNVSTNNRFGVFSLENNTTGSYNTAIGGYALRANTTGSYNTSIGNGALLNNNNNYNTAIGANTLYSNTGQGNTAISAFAGQSNTTGQYNVSIGLQALTSTTIGSNNVAFGYQSLNDNVSGSNNVGIGRQTLRSALGSGNIAVGFGAGFNETGSNTLYIANSSGTSSGIYGDFANSRFGINQAPSALTRTFDINGELRIRDLTTDTPTRIVGADADGDLGEIVLGTGLSFTGNTLNATGGSGSTEYLDPYIISSDTVGFILKNVMDTVQFIGVAGVTGESTTVSDSPTINMTLTGTNITGEIVDGSVTPAKLSQAYLTSEVDGSTTNEIQTLSISGSDLTISGAGGNTVTLPSGGGSSEWASLHYGSLAANTQTLTSSVWNTINFTGSSESNASIIDANHTNDEIEFVVAGTYRVDYRVSFIANADALIYSGIYSSVSSSVDGNTQMESDTDSGYKHTIMQHSYIKTVVAGEKIKLQVQPLIAHTSVAIYSNFIVTKL